MKNFNLKKIGESIVKAYLGLVLLWVTSALSVQVFFLYLHFTNQQERISGIVNEVTWKIDGTFKDNPDNIWYEGPKTK